MAPGDGDHPEAHVVTSSEPPVRGRRHLGSGVASVPVPHVLSLQLELPDCVVSPFHELRVAPSWLFWMLDLKLPL